MRNTRYESPFDTRASEWIGDLTVWTRQNAGDNSERLERLRRNLRQARERGSGFFKRGKDEPKNPDDKQM